MPPITDLVDVTISLESQAATRAGFGTILIAGDSDKLPTTDIVVLTFDAALVASNSIAGKVDGVAITPVVFSGDNDTTMGLLETELASFAGITTAVASDVGAVGYDNTMTCTAASIDTVLLLEEFLVTLGGSQATITITRTPFRRTKEYTNLASVAVDFAVTDPEYIAAAAVFGQSPNPGTLKIGRIDSGNDWTDELDLIRAVDDVWYGLIITDRTLVDQTDVAAWVKTLPKLFAIGSNSTDILDSAVSSDIASVIQADENGQAFAFFLEAADVDYPEAAWMADRFTYQPGEATWMFTGLTNFSPSSLTAAQRAAALAKNANLYETYGSNAITREGKVGYREQVGGDFIDITYGIDWLEADMETRIFTQLASVPKVPYTDAGLAQLESQVRASLDSGIANGLLVADPDNYDGAEYEVTVAKVSTIAAGEKAARNVPGTALAFRATLAGAVHTVEINGIVTI